MIPEGKYTVTFVDGKTRTIQVANLISNHLGQPLMLVAEDGWMYNFNTIIGLKRKA